MKRLLTIFTLGMVFLVSYGQENRSPYTFDYLYLRDADSTVISGWILEQIPGEYVKIELPGGSVLVVEQSRISRITRERSQFRSISRHVNAGQKAYYYNRHGFQRKIELQLALPQGEWGAPVINPGLFFSTGYQWNPYLGSSVGTGLDFLQAGLVLPVFGEINGYLGDHPLTPYYSVKGGYGWALTPLTWNVTDVQGGPMGQASFGVMWHTRSRHQIQLGVGFKYQEVTVNRNGGWDWRTGEPLPGVVLTRAYQGLMINFSFRI